MAEAAGHGIAEERGAGRRVGWVAAGVTAIIVAIIAAFATFGGGRTETVPLSAKITLYDLVLRVANNDSFYWRDMTLYLDGVPDGYKYRHEELAPNSVVEIYLRDFVDDDGYRFDVQAKKPRTIFILAELPSDDGRLRGSWSGGWQ